MNARKILNSVLFNYLAAITTSLVGFVSTPIVLHHLGKSVYGAWVLIASLIGYSSLLDLGVGLTVMRQVAERAHLSDHSELRRIVNTGLTVYSGAGIMIVVAGIAAAAPFAHAFHLAGPVRGDFTIAFALMSVTLGLTFPGGLYTGINQGFGRFRQQGLIVIAQALLGTGTTIVIALLGGGLIALSLGWTTTVILGFVAKVLYARRALGITPDPRRAERRLVRGLMSVSFWMFVINIANKVIWNTDTIVIGSVIGAIAVAHYSVALGPATAVRTLTDQFNSVTYTTAASLRAQAERLALQRLLMEATRVVAACICPFLVLFMLWGREFLNLWVGSGFASSQPTLVVLVVGMLSTSVQATATQILLASEEQSRIARVAVLEAAANLGASVWLAHSIGIEGVALGTTIPTTITAFGYYVPRAAHQLDVPLRALGRRLAGPFILNAAVYAAFRWLVPAFRIDSLELFCVFAAGFAGTLIVAGILADKHERRTYLHVFRGPRVVTSDAAGA